MKKINKKWVIVGTLGVLLLPLTFTLVGNYIKGDKSKDNIPKDNLQVTSKLTTKETIENSIKIENKKDILFNDVNKILVVDLDLKQGVGNDSRKMLAKEDIVNILKQSKENIDDINEVLISFYADLENKYGDASNEEVYRLRYNSEEINKINFENINFLKIDLLADDVFTHPAFN